MSFQAKASIRIGKPVAEVFDAIVNPEKMCNYFISSASGPMVEGATLSWAWGDVGAEGTVLVEKIEQNSRIVFKWPATGNNSTVEINVEALEDGGTKISAVESGNWQFDLASVEAACGQTGGWMHMFLCMKAYLEYGINLRKGAVLPRN
jgi:uncharacterized protein YndB with AHSA1/START domain